MTWLAAEIARALADQPRERRRSIPPRKTCAYCGGPMPTWQGRHSRRVYCSQDCYREARRIMTREYMRAMRGGG